MPYTFQTDEIYFVQKMILFIKWRLRLLVGILSKLMPSRPFNLRDTRKIIVFIRGGIGDGVMVLPALKALINKFPEASVTLVTTRVI